MKRDSKAKNLEYKRLQFALWFIQVDLDRLVERPVEFDLLRADIISFFGFVEDQAKNEARWVGSSNFVFHGLPGNKIWAAGVRTGMLAAIPDPEEKPSFWEFTLDDFKKFQIEAKKIIRRWGDTYSGRGALDRVSQESGQSFNVGGSLAAGSFTQLSLKVRLIQHGPGEILCLAGPFRDVFLTIMFLLAGTARKYVLHCKDETCNKVFVQKDNRQEYCTRQHANRAAVRRWLAKSNTKRKAINSRKNLAKKIKSAKKS